MTVIFGLTYVAVETAAWLVDEASSLRIRCEQNRLFLLEGRETMAFPRTVATSDMSHDCPMRYSYDSTTVVYIYRACR